MVLREFAEADNSLVEVVERRCEEAGAEVLGRIELQPQWLRRRAACATRGGVWDETEASERGGLPWLIVIIAQPHIPENDCDGSRIPEWPQAIKVGAREEVAERFSPSTVNWLHSADDAHEAAEILRSLRPHTDELFHIAARRELLCSPGVCDE